MNRREFNTSVASLIGAASLTRVRDLSGPQASPQVNAPRISRHLAELGEFGKNPQGGVSRLAYSQADLQGREYVMGLMRAAQLEPTIDLAGNIIGRRVGADASLAPLMFGSHIDSVPEGGNYDGPVGSIGAIEVAQTLAESDIATRHPLEVVIFQNEEGGKTGSRVLDGEFTERELDIVTASGRTIGEGIRILGGDPTRLAEARRHPGEVAAFLELHVEQGAILDREQISIGVVEGIVGIKRWSVVVAGFANHAGTTPMDSRQDALLAAARFIQAVNEVVTDMPGAQVGTVGRIQVEPGAPNVVPGRVVVSLEVRDLDMAKIDRIFQAVRTAGLAIGEDSGTTFDFDEFYVSRSAPTHERIRRLVEDAAVELGLDSRRMPSGAGHDAQSIARLAPIGMIFVPSVAGISHSPREFSRPEDIVAGVNVLLRTLLELDALTSLE
jgi:N-carbamoyl-L-amino-acid hydrolase